MKVFYSIEDAVEYSDKKHAFLLSFRNVLFPIFVDYKAYRKWVVFTPGACDRKKPMPVFQRSSYSEQVNGNVISIFDPSLLHNRAITNSWFSGNPSRYYGQYISQLLKNFFSEAKVPGKDVVIFGTSAGGLPAFEIAKRLRGSTVWVGNIQSDASRHSAFHNVRKYLFPKETEGSLLDNFGERFNLDKKKGEFRFYYYQNISDVFHFKNHFSPYREWFVKNRGSLPMAGEFYVYEDSESGHGTFGRDKEIGIINDLLENRKPSTTWADCI